MIKVVQSCFVQPRQLSRIRLIVSVLKRSSMLLSSIELNIVMHFTLLQRLQLMLPSFKTTEREATTTYQSLPVALHWLTVVFIENSLAPEFLWQCSVKGSWIKVLERSWKVTGPLPTRPLSCGTAWQEMPSELSYWSLLNWKQGEHKEACQQANKQVSKKGK